LSPGRWYKKISDPIGEERVEYGTELPANLWALGLGKNIQSNPIGQKGVEYATELLADFWALGIGIKKISEPIGEERVSETYYWTTCPLLSPEVG